MSTAFTTARTEYKYDHFSATNGGHSRCLILDVEVNNEDVHRCLKCSVPASCTKGSIAIRELDDIPHFLQYNVYLKSGYTSYLSAFQCLKGIFLCTNETVNVWSHLLAFAVFFALMVLDNADPMWQLEGNHLTDRVVITAALICFQACMLSSAGYHTFRCHSQRAFKRWLAIDQSGICLGIVGCYLPSVHFGFRCHQQWRQVYMYVCCGLCAAVLYFSLRLRTSSKAFKRIVLPMYCCLVAYGVVPTLHWVYLCGGFTSPLVSQLFPKVVALYIIGMVGFGFYVSQFPERCLPGRFDFAGHSHNQWHLCVVLGMLWMRHCWQDLMQLAGKFCGDQLSETVPVRP